MNEKSAVNGNPQFAEVGNAARPGATMKDADDHSDLAPVVDRAELMAAKARVVAAVDDARRRIERDLHDGLQQRLVSLCLRARQAEASLTHEQQELKSELARIADGLMDALENVREISRGIHPAVLSEFGLGPAVKALARRSPVPVRLLVSVEGRLSNPVEVGVYYIICEALTNVAKHSKATFVDVSIEQCGRVLEVSVHDDGVGGARESGPGLTGLTDRVDALAGTMRLVSPPGCGTRLRVRLPIRPGSGRGREGGKSGEAMQQVDDGDRIVIATGH
jgi:signal transduction histidine kinase